MSVRSREVSPRPLQCHIISPSLYESITDRAEKTSLHERMHILDPPRTMSR
jgi:hypothetical protein